MCHFFYGVDMRALFYLICFCLVSTGHAEEVFDSTLEAKVLKNIKQITFPSMGFEKAGEAYFSPDGKKVVFQAVPNGEKQYQIYIMNLSDLKPRMLSTGKGACTCAYFRPDGKKIIFASSHEDPALKQGAHEQKVPGYQKQNSSYSWEFTPYMNIYEINPDGTGLKALTRGPAYTAECAYSPDGKRIVYASNKDGSMNIYTMKIDGSDERKVTQTHGCYNGGPFFSPDSKQIVFRSDREKQHYLQIYTIHADGTMERKITSNDAVNWAPYWHPSGKAVAFTTSLHGHMHYEIYMAHIKTGKLFRITHNPTFDGLPVFRNDGKKMMWTSKRGPDGTCQLFVADFVLPKEMK
jgi:Tol biopolymer transport system component